jgi:methylated-DNA-protein-cysteine methyltransferase-like protein
MEANFFDNVYAVVRRIPCGRVSTYGAIARYIGLARSSRMVGWALNNSLSQNPPVPAHRVVNRKGLLTGKAAFVGENVMSELLENEGIRIADNQVVDFQKYFWDPIELDEEIF